MAEDSLNTLISAGAGLAGAIIGLIGGYVAYALPAKEKKKAITNAISAEARRLKGVVIAHHAWWQKVMGDPNAATLPLYPFTSPVFDKSVENIGLLEPEFAGKVVEFFGYLAWVNTFQSSRKQYLDAQLGKEFVATYTKALGELVKRAEKLD